MLVGKHHTICKSQTSVWCFHDLLLSCTLSPIYFRHISSIKMISTNDDGGVGFYACLPLKRWFVCWFAYLNIDCPYTNAKQRRRERAERREKKCLTSEVFLCCLSMMVFQAYSHFAHNVERLCLWKIFDALFACLTKLTYEQNVWYVDHSNWEWSSKTHKWKDICFCHIKGIHRIRNTFSWGRITRAYVHFHWGECTSTEKNTQRERAREKKGEIENEKVGINELERDAERQKCIWLLFA